MIGVVVAICVSVAAGAWAEHRWGDRAQAAARTVLDVMLWALLPFVAFFLVTPLELTAGVGAGLGLGYLVLGLVGALAYLLGSRALRLPRPTVGSLVVAVIVVNTGYLGLPLTVAVLGGDDLGAAIAWDALISGPVLFVFGFAVGAAFGTRAGEGPGERARAFVIRNPVLWAVVAALLAPDALAPDALVDVAKAIVFALLPVGFLVLGVNLAAEAEEGAMSFPPPFTPAVGVVVGLRLAVAPALLLGLSALTVDVPDAYLLQAAMPSGINSLVVAHAYGLDLRLTTAALAWSTAVAVVAALGSLVL